MSVLRDEMIQLVIEQDISSIVLLGQKLSISVDDVHTILNELTTEGKLHGYITEDGQRFFRSDLHVKAKSQKMTDDDIPQFLKYDTTVGRGAIIIGLVIMVASWVFLAFAGGTLEAENFGSAMFLMGIIVLLSGCYFIGKQKTI